ncbi:MAG TPA: CAP domain-containing protein [Conexibacter sp.]|nr:CAP domain-containing protein [Conexibacter sp.]
MAFRFAPSSTPARVALVLVPLLLALALLVPAAPANARPAACSAAHVNVERAPIRMARNATLCLLNRVRARHGLPPLRMNPKLSRAARKHSRDMVRRRYFAHDSLDGRSPFERMRATRYVPRGASWVLGENLGWGSGSLAEPKALLRAWMRSPGHRRNILDGRFRDIGIGIVRGAPVGGHGATYTTDFGRRS